MKVGSKVNPGSMEGTRNTGRQWKFDGILDGEKEIEGMLQERKKLGQYWMERRN